MNKAILVMIREQQESNRTRDNVNHSIASRPITDYIFPKPEPTVEINKPLKVPTTPLESVENLGTKIEEILIPTYECYLQAHLLSNSKLIEPVTDKYGPTSRHFLDIYSPVELESDSSMPTIVFIYGGGLVEGNKSDRSSKDRGIFFDNVGSYFAKRGFITVIPDYRLVNMEAEKSKPSITNLNAMYPSGGIDIALVIEFMKATVGIYGFDMNNLFLMGNSAGGIHIATYLYANNSGIKKSKSDPKKALSISPFPLFSSHAPKVIFRGVIYISVPFDFENAPTEDIEIMKTYYLGNLDNANAFCPIGLRRRYNGVKLPLHLNVLAEKDDVEIIVRPHRRFQILFDKERHVRELIKGPAPEEIIIPRHNHVSLILSLNLGGEEDVWANQVVDWMISRIDWSRMRLPAT